METEDSEQEDSGNRRKNKRQKQKAIYESSSDSEYGDEINEDPQINLSPEKDPSKDIFHLFKTVSGINDLEKKHDKIDPFYRKSDKKQRECVSFGRLLNTINQEEYNPVDIKKDMFSMHSKPFLTLAIN